MPKWLPAIILDLHTALPPSTGETAKLANLSDPECCSVFWAQCLVRSVLCRSYKLFCSLCCYCWNWGRGRVSLRCRSSHCKYYMLLGFTDVRNPVLVIKDIRLRAPGETAGAHFRNMRLHYVRLISRRCIFLLFPPHVTNPQHDRGPLSIS